MNLTLHAGSPLFSENDFQRRWPPAPPGHTTLHHKAGFTRNSNFYLQTHLSEFLGWSHLGSHVMSGLLNPHRVGLTLCFPLFSYQETTVSQENN